MKLPLVATVKVVEGGNGCSVGAIPAATEAFDSLRSEFALRFRWSAADLPTLGAEQRVADHLLPLGNVIQQAISGLTFPRAAQAGAPLHQSLPSLVVSIMLEGVEQLCGPSAAFGGILAKHGPPRAMDVFSQVIEVESEAIQRSESLRHRIPYKHGFSRCFPPRNRQRSKRWEASPLVGRPAPIALRLRRLGAIARRSARFARYVPSWPPPCRNSMRTDSRGRPVHARRE